MKRIFLARHAESKAQTEQEFSFDAALSELGGKQSERLGGILHGLDFDMIYLSPLKRARETFERAALPKDKARFDSRIVECLPEGLYNTILPYEKISYGEQDVYNAWNNPSAKRLMAFMNDVYCEDFENILILSHGIALNMMLKIFLGCDCESESKYCFMDNAAVSLLEIDIERNLERLVLWNFGVHLRNEGIVLKDLI
jgi:broad specificity phosphatase PhoE